VGARGLTPQNEPNARVSALKQQGGIMDKIKVLDMIAKDVEEDAAKFDGQPFNGKTVAEYFGNHGAAISALAKVIKSILEGDK